MTRTSIVALGSILLLTACSDETTSPETETSLRLDAVSLAEQNPLAAVLTLQVRGADSVRVHYAATTATNAATAGTLWLPLHHGTGGAATAALLGLRPATTYEISVDLGPGTQTGDPVTIVTAPLPADLQPYELDITGQPFTGYLLTGLVGADGRVYVVALDSTGTIVWYRDFDDYGPAGIGEVRQQPNGSFTAYVGDSWGWQPTFGRFVEFDVLGRTLRTWSAPPPYYVDNHELLLTASAGGTEIGHFFSYDTRTVDLTPIGGRADALLAGHQIIRMRANGQIEYFWNAWDHITIEEWIEEPAGLKLSENIDFDHPNSLQITPDGHYLVSMRNLAQVLKINYHTGVVMWRLGGTRSDFTIEGDPLGGFNGQHTANLLPNGNLLLYDNGLRHSPPQSRAVEYELDMQTMTATMVWEYRPSPAIYTPVVGLAERLRDGNTFISWANVGRMTEVTAAGEVVWQATVNRAGSPYNLGYRVRRIPSLYHHTLP